MRTLQEFFDHEHERLTTVEMSIARAKTELEAVKNETIERIKARRDHLEAAREARQKQITDAMHGMQTRMDAKKQETAATVEGWKRQRELNKLVERADEAEAYADIALIVLEIAQEEALVAALEAIEARREADEALQAAGATR